MNSKYQRWYDEIIFRAKSRVLDCYKETHHILPRALGGDDGQENLVDLTYREHFLVHWLLTKIYDGQARRAMVYALHCMTMSMDGRVITGWQFEVAKRAIKDEALKHAVRRRLAWKAKCKEDSQISANGARIAREYAPKLDPSRQNHRKQLSKMTKDFLAPILNRRRKSRHRPRANDRHSLDQDMLRL